MSVIKWIRLADGLTADKKLETFWHEVVQQILDHASYWDESKNEKLVDVVAKGIYQVLKDNNLSKE